MDDLAAEPLSRSICEPPLPKRVPVALVHYQYYADALGDADEWYDPPIVEVRGSDKVICSTVNK